MRKFRFLSLIMAIACVAFTGLTEVANAAAGDFFYADTRIMYRDANNRLLTSIPSGFENTHRLWDFRASNLGVIKQTDIPKRARFQITFRSTANGQIEFFYTDKYDMPYSSGVYTVRHGTSGYIYDLTRYLNLVEFFDADGNKIAVDGVWFTNTGTRNTNEKCFGSAANGYAYPMHMSPTYSLIIYYRGVYQTYSLANLTGGLYYLPLEFRPATTRSASGSFVVDNDKLEKRKIENNVTNLETESASVVKGSNSEKSENKIEKAAEPRSKNSKRSINNRKESRK